jgi:transcriptional antiterminator RfaH
MTAFAPMPRWYVVQTQPQSELKAVAHLQRQGYETYLPRYLKRRRHARRIDVVAAPLFPRYLFVAINIGVQRWRSIRSTVGVSQLVCHGDEPASISDKIIAQIKQGEDERGFIQIDSRPRFNFGDHIRVLEGAFADCLGVFQGLSDRERVEILLDLLGRKVRVSLEINAIAAA